MIEGWASVRECHSNRRIICDRDRLVGRGPRRCALVTRGGGAGSSRPTLVSCRRKDLRNALERRADERDARRERHPPSTALPARGRARRSPGRPCLISAGYLASLGDSRDVVGSQRLGRRGYEAAQGHAGRVRLGDEDLGSAAGERAATKAFVEWLVEPVARRPTGSWARQVYGADDEHDFARRAILDALALGPADHLGLRSWLRRWAVLRDALVTGASVTGLDHSEEMVALAARTGAWRRGRAPESERLPFADGEGSSAIAMSVVFFFLDDRPAFRAECRRVLRRGGHVAVYTDRPWLRGTRAAPEPIRQARGILRKNDELAELADVRSCAKSASTLGGQLHRRAEPQDPTAERIVSP